MISVDIGLLWGESKISGDLRGDFALEGWTDCNRKFDLDRVSGAFTCALPFALARGQGGESESTSSFILHPSSYRIAIRLAECFSPDSAAGVLNHVPDTLAAGGVDILEAGRVWKTESQTFDNRVWWPVLRIASREDAEPTLAKLREIAALNPLGFTTIQLKDTDADAASSLIPHPSSHFDFQLGDLSTKLFRLDARPLNDTARFVLHGVPIGRGFHWERKESLEYKGELRLFLHPSVHGGAGGGLGLTASNRLPLETYLESAVGSEMRSDLPPAFSQAQAIAARSTVLATANRHHRADGFDLCNDDHCQCYQGTAREANAVIAPIRASAGQVLVFGHPSASAGGLGGDNAPNDKRQTTNDTAQSSLIPHPSSLRVVDARYAKSCGGVSERYAACWGEDDHPYFAVRACGEFPVPDLTDEANARAFVLSHPPAWCDGRQHPYPEPWDKDPLFRWSFRYTRTELGELIERQTGVRVGAVRQLEVLNRAESGRILTLKIVGNEDTRSVWGELNIRRALSPSHLPSSFFVVDYADDAITLTGGGWGHGVGLCQLGAAAMAKDGWSVEEILEHYYPATVLKVT